MPAERYYSIAEFGEGISFGSVVASLTGGTFDSGYVRSAVQVTNSGVNDYIGSMPFVDVASAVDIWIHGRVYLSGTRDGSRTELRCFNSGGVQILRIRSTTGSYNSFVIEIWNGTTFVAITPAFSMPSQVLFTLDLHVACGATGSASLYVDKAQVANGAVTAMVNNVAEVRYSSGGNSWWSQMAGANFDTRDLIIKSLSPTSNGTNTTATGTFADVDENGLNDADMLVFAAAGDKETMNATDYTLPANVGVDSVWVVGRARGDTLDFKWLLRSGGADHESSELTVTTAFTPYGRYWATDPATGSQISQTALNAFEFGAKAI